MTLVETCGKCGRQYAGECGYCQLEQLHEEHERRVELARRRLEGIVPPPDPAARRHVPNLSAL
jgi:hypothetical protein